jgi:hypothetical protein
MECIPYSLTDLHVHAHEAKASKATREGMAAFSQCLPMREARQDDVSMLSHITIDP